MGGARRFGARTGCHRFASRLFLVSLARQTALLLQQQHDVGGLEVTAMGSRVGALREE